MGYVTQVPLMLLQAVTRPDTIIARTIPERGLLDWTNGILQFIVLVAGIVMLAALAWLLVTVRRSVLEMNSLLKQLAAETRPLIASATAVATDARAVVSTVRSNVERVTSAASAVSEQLLHAAETTADRVDEVNAVLDVLQEELEDTAIATVAAVRGVRIGARALTTRRRPPRDDRRDTR